MLKAQRVTARKPLPRAWVIAGLLAVVSSLLAATAVAGGAALTFGVFSFLLILTVAFGVLWYTARAHRDNR